MSGALGIELGTVRVAAALLDSYGNAELVADRQEPARRATDASVYLGEDGCLAGATAEELADADAKLNAVAGTRALFGQREPVFTDAAGRNWSPEGISAILLRKVLRDVEAQAGGVPASISIAAPLWFNDTQRRALRDAAKIAGMANVQLVDEPLAVAAFHRQAIGAPCRMTLLVNFGYSGVTLSILRAFAQGDAIAGTYRETALGMQSLVADTAAMVSAQFAAQTGAELPADPVTARELARVSKSLIESLASGAAATQRRVLPIGGRTIELVLFPHQWARMFEKRQALFGEALQRCLGIAGVAIGELQLVVAYGAGAGIAPMMESLRKSFAQGTIEIIDAQPADAVALGAALLAQPSGGGQAAAGTLATCAHDLGITVFDRKKNAFLVESLIPRGSALPASTKKTMYTNRADQQRMVIQVAQVGGVDGVAVDLGVFEFGPIRAPRKNYPVEITLSYDAEGIVVVSALDQETGTKMEQVVSAEGDAHARWVIDQRAWVSGLAIND